MWERWDTKNCMDRNTSGIQRTLVKGMCIKLASVPLHCNFRAARQTSQTFLCVSQESPSPPTYCLKSHSQMLRIPNWKHHTVILNTTAFYTSPDIQGALECQQIACGRWEAQQPPVQTGKPSASGEVVFYQGSCTNRARSESTILLI